MIGIGRSVDVIWILELHLEAELGVGEFTRLIRESQLFCIPVASLDVHLDARDCISSILFAINDVCIGVIFFNLFLNLFRRDLFSCKLPLRCLMEPLCVEGQTQLAIITNLGCYRLLDCLILLNLLLRELRLLN